MGRPTAFGCAGLAAPPARGTGCSSRAGRGSAPRACRRWWASPTARAPAGWSTCPATARTSPRRAPPPTPMRSGRRCCSKPSTRCRTRSRSGTRRAASTCCPCPASRSGWRAWCWSAPPRTPGGCPRSRQCARRIHCPRSPRPPSATRRTRPTTTSPGSRSPRRPGTSRRTAWPPGGSCRPACLPALPRRQRAARRRRGRCALPLDRAAGGGRPGVRRVRLHAVSVTQNGGREPATSNAVTSTSCMVVPVSGALARARHASMASQESQRS